MRPIPALSCAAVLLALASVAPRAAAQSPAEPGWVREGATDIRLPDTTRYGPAERAVLALERRRSASIAAHDTAALARIYAPDLRAVTAFGGVVDRATLFGVFARDDPSARFTIDELRVRAVSPGPRAPTVIVVSGRLRTLRDGKEAGASRYLHVWERRSGGWMIAEAQGTVVRGD